jgi:hypothetical protein
MHNAETIHWNQKNKLTCSILSELIIPKSTASLPILLLVSLSASGLLLSTYILLLHFVLQALHCLVGRTGASFFEERKKKSCVYLRGNRQCSTMNHSGGLLADTGCNNEEVSTTIALFAYGVGILQQSAVINNHSS